MKRLTAGMALCLVLPMLAAADDPFGRGHDSDAAKGPEGVKFEVTLSAKQYHMGEPIRMTYAFSSSKAGAWQLNMQTYDRSGRLMTEYFHVDPAEGTADPMGDYFGMFQGMFGGGLSAMPPTLGEKPVEMQFDMNEWVRFDKPGKYRVYAGSLRASALQPSTGPAGAGGAVVYPAVSNVVELEILPFDAGWSKGQLEEIRKALDARPGDLDAGRRLRFLNTPEAVSEMVKRLGSGTENGWNFQAGIVGAGDRANALAAMQKELVAPEGLVDARFLSTLQMLDVMVAEKGRPRALWGATTAEAEANQQSWKEHQARMEAALRRYVEQLAASLPKKAPAARAVALLALEQSPAKEVAKPNPALAGALAEVFETLKPGDQLRLLEYDWPRARTPALLPKLLQMLDARPTMTNEGLELRDWAMTRAYELDPKTVRPMILAEMKAPLGLETLPASYHMHALLALPDATLPEIDETLAGQLSGAKLRDLEMTSRLMSRYATPAIEGKVKSFFEPHAGSWACTPQASFLAYFLRVDEPYGVEMFSKCLASRKSGCWRMLFGEVGQLIWTPGLEKLAVGSLSAQDVEIPMTAANMLKQKGAPGVKEALFAALTGRYVANPAGDAQTPKDPVAARRRALVEALLHGHQWVLTGDELQNLAKLAVDEGEVETCREQAKAETIRIDLRSASPYVDREMYGSVEEVEAKMLLYPARMKFTLLGNDDAVSKELLDWAAGHDRQVTRGQP